MTKARRPEGTPQNYFMSFTDLLIGILFIFIVLLVTYALTYKRAEAGLQARIKNLEQYMCLRTELLGRLEGNLRRRGVAASADVGQGVLRFRENLLFERGSADLDTRAMGALNILAAELARELPCFTLEYRGANCPHGAAPVLEALYIEGHTDNVNIRTRQFPSNWELSSARAIRTYRYIIARQSSLKDIRNASGSARLLGSSAYADTRAAQEPADLAVNRRIDFRFLLAPPSQEPIIRPSAQCR